jgi:hypothetical protein
MIVNASPDLGCMESMFSGTTDAVLERCYLMSIMLLVLTNIGILGLYVLGVFGMPALGLYADHFLGVRPIAPDTTQHIGSRNGKFRLAVSGRYHNVGMNQAGSTQGHAAGNTIPGISSLFRTYSAHNQGPIIATDSCTIGIPRSVRIGFQFCRMVHRQCRMNQNWPNKPQPQMD